MSGIYQHFGWLPDHHGSRVHESGLRSVVMQPYGDHDSYAAALCEALNLRLISAPGAEGPWCPGTNGTRLYEFLPA
jgi:hypothetical protein